MIPYSAVEEAMEKAGLGSDDKDKDEVPEFIEKKIKSA